MNTKYQIFAAVFAAALFFAHTPLFAKEGEIEGTISGAGCAVHGMQCPESHNLTIEMPGILTNDSKFYYLGNLPQDFLANYSLHKVSVEGDVYEKLATIIVKKLKLKEGDKWKTIYDNGSITDPMGHKVELSKAKKANGAFMCPACAQMGKK